MGCASAKPKRTISLDDVNNTKHNKKNVNGQVGKIEDVAKKQTLKETGNSNPIPIPQPNRSFQAPDGIPFIDEDAPEDEQTELLRENVRLSNHSAEVKDNRISSRELALVVPPKVVTSSIISTLNNVTTSSIITNNTSSALGINANKVNIKNDIPTMVVPSVRVESTDINMATTLKNKQPMNEEKAATKIQANVRGFLERNKHKSSVLNSVHDRRIEEDSYQSEFQPPLELRYESAPSYEPPHQDIVVCYRQEPGTNYEYPEIDQPTCCYFEEFQGKEIDLNDPEATKAAIKIQAMYKGYRIRKAYNNKNQ